MSAPSRYRPPAAPLAARQPTLGALIRSNAVLHAGRPALVDGALRIGWRDLDRRTDRLAAWLVASGIGAGDRVGLLLLDGAPFVELLIATGKVGAIAVTLNWRLAAPELAYILADCDPALIVHSAGFAPLLPPDRDSPRLAVDDAYTPGGAYDRHATETPPLPALDPILAADPLYMMYTSGTTGRPKGCLQSHEGAIASAFGFAVRRTMRAEDRMLSTSPLFHVAGLNQLLAALAAGAATIFPPRGADPAALLDLMSAERCTVASPVPSLLIPMRKAQAADPRPLALRTITGAAGATSPAKMAWIGSEWDCRYVGGYGQTEAGGWVTLIDHPDMLDHPSAIGWPLPHLAMAILDADGHPVPGEAEGEIGLRGASVMLGYWNNEPASAQALATGWLRTGDLGRRDALGLFHLLGRSKELIKTGGENVYPAEVDDCLLRLAGIADAAIAGVPDRRWGEAVKAFVVLKPGATLAPADITAWCRAHIAGYKRPRYIEYLDALPRDSFGKLRRVDLAARPVTPDQAVE